MGVLTDKYGSKFVMLLSVGGATLYYISILSASNIYKKLSFICPKGFFKKILSLPLKDTILKFHMLYLSNIPAFF